MQVRSNFLKYGRLKRSNRISVSTVCPLRSKRNRTEQHLSSACYITVLMTNDDQLELKWYTQFFGQFDILGIYFLCVLMSGKLASQVHREQKKKRIEIQCARAERGMDLNDLHIDFDLFFHFFESESVWLCIRSVAPHNSNTNCEIETIPHRGRFVLCVCP